MDNFPHNRCGIYGASLGLRRWMTAADVVLGPGMLVKSTALQGTGPNERGSCRSSAARQYPLRDLQQRGRTRAVSDFVEPRTRGLLGPI
jgi:hypothetical protein